MIPWSQLDATKVAGGGELKLMKRGTEFSIMLGAIELMNSRLSGSEEALATLSCQKIAGRQNPSILIGGLGMGFTLRAALGELGSDAKIVVAELVPSVIAWAHGPMAEVFGTSLDDPRVTISEGDVGRVIKAGKAAYDAIMLDVDNGPEGLTRESNDSLYSWVGLSAARDALRPGGVLSVWSSSPNADFTKRLEQTGFEVEEVKVRANGSRGGARHVIWVAVNSKAPGFNPAPRGKRR